MLAPHDGPQNNCDVKVPALSASPHQLHLRGTPGGRPRYGRSIWGCLKQGTYPIYRRIDGGKVCRTSPILHMPQGNIMYVILSYHGFRFYLLQIALSCPFHWTHDNFHKENDGQPSIVGIPAPGTFEAFPTGLTTSDQCGLQQRWPSWPCLPKESHRGHTQFTTNLLWTRTWGWFWLTSWQLHDGNHQPGPQYHQHLLALAQPSVNWMETVAGNLLIFGQEPWVTVDFPRTNPLNQLPDTEHSALPSPWGPRDSWTRNQMGRRENRGPPKTQGFLIIFPMESTIYFVSNGYPVGLILGQTLTKQLRQSPPITPARPLSAVEVILYSFDWHSLWTSDEQQKTHSSSCRYPLVI